MQQNGDGGIGRQNRHDGNLSSFTYPSRGFVELKRRYLTEEERKAAHLYFTKLQRSGTIFGAQAHIDNQFIKALADVHVDQQNHTLLIMSTPLNLTLKVVIFLEHLIAVEFA